MDRGVTQGCLASPNASNITVDTVVSTVMLEYLETQESHNGLGWAEEEHNMVFYVDNGCIAGCKPIWVHTIMMVVVSMFKRLGLQITSAILKQGTLEILNHLVAGSTIVIQVSLVYFYIIAPPGWCCLIDL